jgi:hypothetical protein
MPKLGRLLLDHCSRLGAFDFTRKCWSAPFDVRCNPAQFLGVRFQERQTPSGCELPFTNSLRGHLVSGLGKNVFLGRGIRRHQCGTVGSSGNLLLACVVFSSPVDGTEPGGQAEHQRVVWRAHAPPGTRAHQAPQRKRSQRGSLYPSKWMRSRRVLHLQAPSRLDAPFRARFRGTPSLQYTAKTPHCRRAIPVAADIAWLRQT